MLINDAQDFRDEAIDSFRSSTLLHIKAEKGRIRRVRVSSRIKTDGGDIRD